MTENEGDQRAHARQSTPHFPRGGKEEMEGVILAGGQSLANQIREKLNHEQILGPEIFLPMGCVKLGN